MFVTRRKNTWYSYDFGWFVREFSMIFSDFWLPGSVSGLGSWNGSVSESGSWNETDPTGSRSETLFYTEIPVYFDFH